LYVNHRFVAFGPVKGDRNLWFFDDVDIATYLVTGRNIITVTVLRFFYATPYAASFPRLPSGGQRIVLPERKNRWRSLIESSTSWETAIDTATLLRIDQHVYEATTRPAVPLVWTPAKLVEYKSSTGNSLPWQLSPRLIPHARREKTSFSTVRNIQSSRMEHEWITAMNSMRRTGSSLHLPASTKHTVDLEVEHHTTAFLRFRFQRPATGGSVLKVTYSESYESEPEAVPWVRCKDNRCDYSRDIFGPSDLFEFRGQDAVADSGCDPDEAELEVFAPFHYRTFRFLRLEFIVGSSELVFLDLDVEAVTYPLDIHASFSAPGDEFSTQL
jgi:hypothetical protein